jgi:hypothetical protein
MCQCPEVGLVSMQKEELQRIQDERAAQEPVSAIGHCYRVNVAMVTH